MNMYNYRFLILFDASMCTPMPDPLTSEPRTIWTDGRGFITPQAIKYRIKKYLYENGEEILHFEKSDDYTVFKEIDAYNLSPEEAKERELEYLDVRLFGAMDMARDKKNGKDGHNAIIKIKGPVTLSQAVTIDPITVRIVSINRTYKVDTNEDGSNQGSSYANDSAIIEYGLYSCYGGVNAIEGEKCRLSDRDMEKFFEAVAHMFDNDCSVMRPIGSMLVRHVFVWKWKDELVSESQLKDCVRIILKEGISKPSRFSDYSIEVGEVSIPVIDYAR